MCMMNKKLKLSSPPLASNASSSNGFYVQIDGSYFNHDVDSVDPSKISSWSTDETLLGSVGPPFFCLSLGNSNLDAYF